MNTTWEEVRAAFSLDPEYVHLALGMLSSHPNSVRKAIDTHRGELDNNPTLYYRNKEACEKHTLERAAAYLATTCDKIAITESTTMGLAVVYTGLQTHPGDEILTTVHEHYAALEIFRFKEKRSNVTVRAISLYEDSRNVTKDQIVERIVQNITNKTKLVALTWVHSCTGVKLPIRDIADRIAQINLHRPADEKILLSIDGVHGFGIEDIQVEELGCDFFISGCHKWLFGPRGTGLIWAKNEAWERIVPIMTSFKWDAFWSWFTGKDPDTNCHKAWLCTPGGFQPYEHRWAMGEAFDFHLSIGKKAIQDRVHLLNSYCKEAMSHMPHIRLYTPQSHELSSGIICFTVLGMEPHAVVEALLKQGIIIGQTPYRTSYSRFMPSIVNSYKDLDKALSSLSI